MIPDLLLGITVILQNHTGLTDTAVQPGFWKKKTWIIYIAMTCPGQEKLNVNKKILEIYLCS